eukprot:1177125-Prorocentrum_minimum.AAC.1
MRRALCLFGPSAGGAVPPPPPHGPLRPHLPGGSAVCVPPGEADRSGEHHPLLLPVRGGASAARAHALHERAQPGEPSDADEELRFLENIARFNTCSYRPKLGEASDEQKGTSRTGVVYRAQGLQVRKWQLGRPASELAYETPVVTHVSPSSPGTEATDPLADGQSFVVYGQDHLHTDDQSFVFLLKVGGNQTLYGVCVLVHEVVQQPPGLAVAAAVAAKVRLKPSLCRLLFNSTQTPRAA